jgi:tetratricopeptide (TPR) repeat protein
LFLFALALLAKEAAIFFPILIFLFRLLWSSEDKSKIDLAKIVDAGRFALPFLVVAVLYLAARIIILGYITAERPWYQPLTHILLTIPSIIAFYLRQPIFPYPIGPSYPIRIVNPAAITFENFWLPLVSVILGLALLLWVVRRSTTKQFGLALFFLFLIPAFNVNAFHPEQIVHDRYLYLPLLGLLIILIPLLNTAVKRILNEFSNQAWKTVRPAVITLLITAVLTIPLAVQTIKYNTAWKNELALWQWAVETDPTSMLNTYLNGYYLFRNGRLEEAETAMNAVIRNQPLSGPYYTYLRAIEAHLERADIVASQGRAQEARQDLELIINHIPTEISDEDRTNLNAQKQRAVERLALSFVQERDYETAVQILENGRQQLPQLACTFTTNLAVSLYISGQKEQALKELEDNQSRIEAEFTPLCKISLFYLGQLYLELGRTTEARTVLTDFLTASRPFYDAQTTNLQQQALDILNQIQNP